LRGSRFFGVAADGRWRTDTIRRDFDANYASVLSTLNSNRTLHLAGLFSAGAYPFAANGRERRQIAMTLTQPASAPDRRRAPRRIVALAGRLRFQDGIYLPCTVRDISPMGAKLELSCETILPMRFRLQIPDDLFEADCELKYRNGRCVGVEFQSARAEAMARYA
jgi:hypothetical protein